jgi:excisionase family DNA binding protein
MYPAKEACAMLGIGVNSFYEAVRDGRLRAKKLGAKTLVLHADLEEFARSLPDLKLAKKAVAA